jgi:hypothetical protein
MLTKMHCKNLKINNIGTWLSLVEHLPRVQGVAGSNPAVPTIFFLEPWLQTGTDRIASIRFNVGGWE